MTARVTSRTVTFRRPFMLTGFDRTMAAGSYAVETEEEQIDTISFPVWKRTSTSILLQQNGAIEYQPIDPEELKKALSRDAAPEEPSQT